MLIHHNTLSLSTVILININIMIGTGLFINTTQLAKSAGILGSFSYLFVGILLLPLIFSIARLLTFYPVGGFYTFGSQAINTFAGFISTWSYFFGKLGSATVGIHTFVTIVQEIIPFLGAIPIVACDGFLLLFFIFLNSLNVTTGNSIQLYLLCLKLIPILFLFLTGIFFFNGNNVTFLSTTTTGFSSTIPLVLFSLLGFEAACSLSRNLDNPRVNGSRAILISYGIVLSIAVLYQFIFYGILGDSFLYFNDYKDVYPAIISKIFTHSTTQHCVSTIIHLAIGSSALSGAYGILFGNQWNLYTLAEKNHIIGSSFFVTLNKYGMPFVCMIAQAIICLCYIVLTQGRLFILQQLAALAVVLTYSISLWALLKTLQRKNERHIVPLLGLVNCVFLLGVIVYNLWLTGPSTFLAFISILCIGSTIFYIKLPKNTQ